MRWAAATAAFAAIYLLMTGSASPVDAAVAVGFGAAIAWRWSRPRRARRPGAARRILFAPWLVVGGAREAVRGSWAMAHVIVGRRRWQKVGVIHLPISARTHAGAVVTALVATLSPGSVVLDVDTGARVFRVSVIDATDPDALRVTLDRFYRRYQQPLIP